MRRPLPCLTVTLTCLALSALGAPAFATPTLIALAKIDGDGADKVLATKGKLENGVPGNLLGGLGSGLTWLGGDRFIALPDRGPNAVEYNAGVDNTASYIPRFHNLTLKLKPSAGSGGLPFEVMSQLTATTLLASPTALVYGDGKSAGLGGGAPALNDTAHNYFSGRSDNFDPTKTSGNPNNARFDPEGVRVSADGRNIFISDEYGPDLYQFDARTGLRLKSFSLPPEFLVDHLSAKGDEEIKGNARGRVANKGMEGLALTPDGRTLAGIMQSPLEQDGGTKAGFVRILTVDLLTGTQHQYAYALSNVGTEEKPKFTGISEIVAVNDHVFLVDERDGKGMGDGTAAAFKHLYRIDLNGASDVAGLSGADALKDKAVTKSLFLDIVAAANAAGIAAEAIPAKLEGVSFGPDVTVQGESRHTLWVASDNDFLATVGGAPNPNVILVFAVAPADLPDYKAAHSAAF